MKIYALLTALILATVSPTWAATYASDGSVTSIQTIHGTLAVDGDTITLPAGTFTWTTTLTISKAITLQGAGVGSTIIKDGMSNGAAFMKWNLVAGKLSHLT